MILQKLGLHESKIIVGVDCFEEALKTLGLKRFSALFVVSQENVWRFHGPRLDKALQNQGLDWKRKLVADGETTKNLTVFGELLSWLADHRADRQSLLIVLGGGVVGDLSGFVASAYMRGIQWVYLPTTLLAQQDAAVGGKVAVNLPQGKNLVGHFWHPLGVIIDGLVLQTLPRRELNAGYMEFLKHGMLKDEALFLQIAEMDAGEKNWSDHLPLLARGMQVKVDVVAEDPTEKGRRKLLNLGHTLGHALESYTNYRVFLHGEAVGLGLIFVAVLSLRLGGSYDWKPLFQAVLSRLPKVDVSGWDPKAILDLTLLDKKGVKGNVTWIVPFRPGKVEMVPDVPRVSLEEAFVDFLNVLRV